MKSKMFVNLPVSDLPKSMAFFQALGFTFNPAFSDETAACMVISEENYAMLLTHDKFKAFTSRAIADTERDIEVIVAISLDSKEAIDKMADAAIAHGGNAARPPEDMGFMFTRAFNDLDGHTWEPFWMDPAAIPQS